MSLIELKPGCFIYQFKNSLPVSGCENIVRRFESNSEQQYQGRIGQSQDIRTDVKRSTDLRVSGREEWRDVDELLHRSLSSALSHLSSVHPFFAKNRFKDIGYNLQRTQAGEFYHWHIDSGPGEFSQRQLVAIWYLNDVADRGGQTEFYFQNIRVTPEAGKLILFPPFWTHVHRGGILERGVKYIATTWICFE